MNDDYLQSLDHLAMGTRLKRAGVALQGETQKWLRANGCDIPSAHLPVITALDRKGPTSIGVLTRMLGIAQPGVSRMVEQLTAGGWVSSRTDPRDRRIREIQLTEKGQAFVDTASLTLWPVIDSAVARLCAGLVGPFMSQLSVLEDRLASGKLEGNFRDAQAEPVEPS
jgi:DNA-binding MarR family transcriptional regulator